MGAVANISDFRCRVARSWPIRDYRSGFQPASVARAFDMFSNPSARMGWGTPSLAEDTEYNLVRLSYNYWLLITMFRNHWISRRIVETPAKDMVRAWPRLTSEIDPKEIGRFERVIRNTATKAAIFKTLWLSRLFGGAGALIVIDGQENILDEPLDIADVELGAYKGLIPFDRWVGIYPEGELCSDINRPLDFNLPEYYRVTVPGARGFKVHSSRILRFCGPAVPTPEYEAQGYWGISALEPPYQEVQKRDNMSWNILSLTFRASIIGMKFDDLAQMLSGAGMSTLALQGFYARMEALNQLMSNQSLIPLPKDGGFEHVAASFPGVADIYQQFQLDIAGASEIPVSRLFGRTITGLGQSNDADERIYEERIAMDQEHSMRPQLEQKLYPVICMSEFGEVPKDLDLIFPSIRVLSEQEKAELAKNTVDAIAVLFDRTIYDKAKALKDIKQSSDVTGFGTNITDEDIEAAEQEPELPPIGAGETEHEPKDPLEGLEREANARAADTAIREREFAGFPLGIEYPAGARRTLRNPEGDVVYDRKMAHDYGFIRYTVGRDGDEIDVIVGPDESAAHAFIVDMIDLGPDVDRREDEDKVMLGFRSAKDAKRAFLSMYPESFFGGMRQVTLDQLREKTMEPTLA